MGPSQEYARVDLEENLPAQDDPTSNEVKDSENGMWSKYLGHVKEYDTELTETWKEDANGVLTFTAIFSATVAAFIIESYKKLSPDSGDKTTFLLDQLSQQFAGFANGTNIQPQPYQQSSPGVFIICVNIVWLLSLVLSSTSALFSTLTQQWARKYLQLPQIQSIPSERARVRSYLFHGTRKFAMNDIIQTAPTLLHLSVFLFNIGLVMYFYTICKPVAFVVLGSVGFFGVAYLTLTILPCLDLTCPYSTPLSRIAWFLVHCSASVAYSFFHVVAKLLHCLLVPSNPGEVKTWRQGILTDLRERIGGSRDRYKQRRRDGFRESIVKDALQAPRDIDFKALTWLFQLPALAEKSNFERFVATMPGKTAIELFSLPRGYGEVSFREHLSALLRSCASATVRLDEDVRSSRLSVCLDAVHHVAKAAIVPNGVLPSNFESLLDEVRIKFANIGVMRALWADKDLAIRVNSRSICALFARKLLRKFPVYEPELAWLQEVLGEPSSEIYKILDDQTKVDKMNVDAFVYGVLSRQTEDLPRMQATAFADTLAILMNSGTWTALRRDVFEDGLSSLIRRVEQGNHIDRDNVVRRLRRLFPDFLRDGSQQPQASNP